MMMGRYESRFSSQEGSNSTLNYKALESWQENRCDKIIFNSLLEVIIHMIHGFHGNPPLGRKFVYGNHCNTRNLSIKVGFLWVVSEWNDFCEQDETQYIWISRV